jgi:hypothetical protein
MTPKWGALGECQEWILRVHRGETPELFSGEELEEILEWERQRALSQWEGLSQWEERVK